MKTCDNCHDVPANTPTKYVTTAVCGKCYREYRVYNFLGQQKYRGGVQYETAKYSKHMAPVHIINDQKRRWQRDKHAADIVQPYKGSAINPAFVKLYPDQARKMFAPSELKKVAYGIRGDARKSNPEYAHQHGV